MTERSSKSPNGDESNLRKGSFIFFKKQIYSVLEYDRDKSVIQVRNEISLEIENLTVRELFIPDDAENYLSPKFAPTRTQLYQLIEQLPPEFESPPTVALSKWSLDRADIILERVAAVDALVEEGERLAKLHNHNFKRAATVIAACTKVSTPENPINKSTYYDDKKFILQNHADRNQMAASLRRSTFNQTKRNKAQEHFLDVVIMYFYARANVRLRSKSAYRLACDTLKHRNGLWPDPEKYKKGIPQDLIRDLLDDQTSIESILSNDDHKDRFTKIEMPSQSSYFRYLRWFESLPELGKEVVNKRHGKGTWESIYLVYESFVDKATSVLQYVFADHYLLDVFTVD